MHIHKTMQTYIHALHYITLHNSALQYVKLHCIALHYIQTLHTYITYMTWHDVTWRDMTWHDMTLHYITWHDLHYIHYITVHCIAYMNDITLHIYIYILLNLWLCLWRDVMCHGLMWLEGVGQDVASCDAAWCNATWCYLKYECVFTKTILYMYSIPGDTYHIYIHVRMSIRLLQHQWSH